MVWSILPLLMAFAGQTPPVQVVPRAGAAVPAQTLQAPAPRPAPPPTYDPNADARALIAAAVKGAATDGIRVLVNFGANDDDGSKAFSKARSAPEILKSTPSFFSDEYKVANIDVGHLDKNLDVASSYGVTLAAGDLPALVILDDRGQVVARTSAQALRLERDAAALDPVKIAAFLTAHEAPAPDATAQFADALKQAKADGKRLFVWFSAPW
jgi:hypothetical protein